MRSTRNQPFCWQEKKILRKIRKSYTGSELCKLRNLYLTITEMDSDFNNQDIKFYTKTISTYGGLSKEWIPSGLKILQKMKVLQIVEDREGGKFKGKRLIFTPQNVEEIPQKTVTGKPVNGESVNGKDESSEDISLLEDIHCKEDNKKNLPAKRRSLKPKDPLYAFGKDESGNPTLCQRIEDSFLHVQKFTEFSIERKAIKRIAGYAYKDSPEDPAEFCHRFLNYFYQIKKDRNHWLNDTPFVPSSISYNIYQRIKSEMDKKEMPQSETSKRALKWLFGEEHAAY